MPRVVVDKRERAIEKWNIIYKLAEEVFNGFYVEQRHSEGDYGDYLTINVYNEEGGGFFKRREKIVCIHTESLHYKGIVVLKKDVGLAEQAIELAKRIEQKYPPTGALKTEVVLPIEISKLVKH